MANMGAMVGQKYGKQSNDLGKNAALCRKIRVLFRATMGNSGAVKGCEWCQKPAKNRRKRVKPVTQVTGFENPCHVTRVSIASHRKGRYLGRLRFYTLGAAYQSADG
jgi:hypothetical protein